MWRLFPTFTFYPRHCIVFAWYHEAITCGATAHLHKGARWLWGRSSNGGGRSGGPSRRQFQGGGGRRGWGRLGRRLKLQTVAALRAPATPVHARHGHSVLQQARRCRWSGKRGWQWSHRIENRNGQVGSSADGMLFFLHLSHWLAALCCSPSAHRRVGRQACEGTHSCAAIELQLWTAGAQCFLHREHVLQQTAQPPIC